MAKKGVYKISGNTKPTVGKKEFYIVDQWYPATPLSDRNLAKVTWELFIKTDNGFRSTNVKKKGINHFTFGKNAYKYVYKIEGYLHEPEGNSPMSLIVYPQKNEEKKIVTEKNIKNVVLTYENGSTINKTLSYRDRLQATATCEGLEGEKIVFKLWEDDEAKNGHNNKNQFITKSPPVEVNKFGKAKWSFSLNSTFISLANKREDDKSKHEYYVTAEFSGKILEDSQNVNVTNPEYKIEQPQQLPQRPKRQPRGNSSPKPKQESPKASTRPSSPNNQPDMKGKISSIKLVDIHGKQFSKNPKFGDVIKLIIEGKDVVGQPYRLKLWEHDNTGEDDLLYNQEHTFKSDKQEVYIRLLDEYRTIGEIGNNSKKPDSGEYWTGNHQEIFAEVIFLGIKSESQRIDIDLKEEPKKEIQHVSPAIVKDPKQQEKKEDERTDETCGLEYRDKIQCTRYKSYGPVYWGALKLANYSNWNILLSSNKITLEEKEIIIGMSENEGKLDSVQSYDSEIVTVGAMQKTINPQGYGEFPIQMHEFKEEYPERFKKLFENCGWTVKKEGEKYRAYYLDTTGSDLKNKIRDGFNAKNFKKKIQCVPIEPLINAAKDPYFQAKQIEDFIIRLHLALNETIVKKYHLNNKKVRIADENFPFKAKDILKSKLGKATILDHSVNRPALTKFDLGSALNRFFDKYPNVSKNPSEWGEKHQEYEKKILDDYGINRKGTDMSIRYNRMKNNTFLK
ncbi:hypothetical protein ACFQO9_09330 [Chryseobacterium zhengzhouense]|uniref:LysM domain-containing protein n=1 Tax=Chryseobacterium zhengzhouense TaxID=1636086 RepID=A0ABW2LZ33_9FLAO